MKEFIDLLIIEVVNLEWDGKAIAIPFRRSLFEQEPPLIDEEVARVHLAGMAEHLAQLSSQDCPEWCLQDCYFLDDPVYLGRQHSREIILRETPSAFRRMHLFGRRPLRKLFALRERLQAVGS